MVNTVVVWLHILGPYWCLYVALFSSRKRKKERKKERRKERKKIKKKKLKDIFSFKMSPHTMCHLQATGSENLHSAE